MRNLEDQVNAALEIREKIRDLNHELFRITRDSDFLLGLIQEWPGAFQINWRVLEQGMRRRR